ncbi:MAG: O-antigen ligase family protein [Alphaproteobacteria bacterium]
MMRRGFLIFFDLKNFFVDKKIIWQDKAIAVIVALSFALSIILKERGALFGLFLIPILLSYPYSIADKKIILKNLLSPIYLGFYLLLAIFAFAISWGLFHNDMISTEKYFDKIFLHGWFVIGRFLLLAIVLSVLWWFFRQKPSAVYVTIGLTALIALLVMIALVVMIEMNVLGRHWFRNDQYSQNVAILFLLLLPFLFYKNILVWLCLPFIFLLHLPVMEIDGWIVGYGTARLWTIGIFMGIILYLLLPIIKHFSKYQRVMLWAGIGLVYLFMIAMFLLGGLFYKPDDPFNHPLLSLVKFIGFDPTSIKERFKFWHFIFYYIIENPLTGYGLNINRHLLTLDSDYSTMIFSLIPYHAIKGECFYINGCAALNQPHFIWIELLLDAGILAPMVLFGLFSMVLWYLLVSNQRPYFYRGAMTFFITFAFCFILTNSFYAFWQNYIGGIAMVLLLNHNDNVIKNRKLKKP